MEQLEAAVANAGAGANAEAATLIYMELDNFDAIKQDVGIAASDVSPIHGSHIAPFAVGPFT